MHCLRMSPLFGVALIALRGRWLMGLITGSGARSATATAAAQPWPSVQSWATHPWATGLFRGAGTSVSQFFVWVYVVLGVILGVTALSGVLNWAVEEIKLHREITRPRPRPRPYQ
jgi:hypothetical protein